MKIYIIVTLVIEGVHRWAECNIDEVMYLNNLHRHSFTITVNKEVSHTNRDIEIIQLKHNIMEYIKAKYYDNNYKLCNFNNKSCEDICIELANEFDCIQVTVLEDNENGATVKRD